MSSIWPAGVTPFHAELDPALSVVGSLQALPESARRGARPWSEGIELPPQLDGRFAKTTWGDWTKADRSAANDRIWDLLQSREELHLGSALQPEECFSPSDRRFTLDAGFVRKRGTLRRKVLDEVPAAEQFQRYLPVLELEVLGSADPTTDLRAQFVNDIAVVGWVDALGLKKTPNDRLFVVRLRGDSMEGGANPLVDGAWLVLELTDQVDSGTISAVQLHQHNVFTVVLKRLHVEG